MKLKKNQEITLKIDDLGNNGEGIGHVDGYALFVMNALPGETIRARIMKCGKSYGYARVMEVLEDSGSGRVEPRCPAAERCGGCTIQHLTYERQLAYKEKKVRDCLVRIGGVDADEVEWLPIIGMEDPWQYRNKAQFPVRMQKDNEGRPYPAAGFYAGRTHSIVPVSDCAIQHSCMKRILETVLTWMRDQNVPAYDESSHSGLVRHIYIRRAYHTGQIMVCLVINSRGISNLLQEMLLQKLTGIPGMTGIFLNSNTDWTNVILGKEMKLLWGQAYIEDRIGDIRYHISPQSFYQVNPEQTEKLYQTALEFAGLSGEETVWDLYCGIGTISLFLAQRARKVYGVEIVPEAVQNAKENARLNGIVNAEFFCGAAEEVVPRLAGQADVVVVDPPRKGCDGVLLDTIAGMGPERIVYVSCDPGTLARDVKKLGEMGYGVKKVRAVDMFGQGGNVETVVMLSHKKPDSVINVTVEFGEGEGKVPLDNIAKRAEAYKPKERVTYKMIKEYIEAKYGFKVHTAYIAEVKRELGLPMYDAPNAVEELKQPRKHPTVEKAEAIKDALRHFEVI